MPVIYCMRSPWLTGKGIYHGFDESVKRFNDLSLRLVEAYDRPGKNSCLESGLPTAENMPPARQKSNFTNGMQKQSLLHGEARYCTVMRSKTGQGSIPAIIF
jgi:hypothetical protein